MEMESHLTRYRERAEAGCSLRLAIMSYVIVSRLY